MSQPTLDVQGSLRRGAYLLLIVISAAVMLGRILAVDSVDRLGLARQRLRQTPQEPAALRRPFLSANDRSRWCIVRALVEPEMHVPGAPYAIDRVIAQPGWDTIDMVKHDGHLYSSKPPLYPTLLAGEYWVIYRLTGATLGSHPYAIGRFMVVTVNLIPLVVMWLLLARLVERFGRSDWGRLFVMGAATFGTFLSTFVVVINNHLPGAVCALVTLYAAIRIWFDGERRVRYFWIAGLFAGLTAACELPALALLAGLGVMLLWRAPRGTLVGFLPAAAIVVAGFFLTNWIAHGDLRPPYMHHTPGDNWYDYTYQRAGRQIESYWRHPQGLDQGEPSTAVYALHSLVGHHGIFSLTPVWLLSVLGLGIWLFQREDRRLRELALGIAALSVVVVCFYLFGESIAWNYGGMTSGFRWVFWLVPLWLLAMIPAADAMSARRWTRAVALVLLAASVLSASYPTWNPWTQPWLYDWMRYIGWI